MIRKYTLIFICSLYSLTSLGQATHQARIIWEQNIKSKALSDGLQIPLYEDASGIYYCKYGFQPVGLSYNIMHYSHAMKLITEEPVVVKNGRKYQKIEALEYINNKLYLFSSFKDKKLKRTSFYIQTIDKKTLKPNNDVKVIKEIPHIKGKVFNTTNLFVGQSIDKTQFYVVCSANYNNRIYSMKSRQKLGVFLIYDNNLNLLYETQPFKSSDNISLKSIILDSQKGLFLLVNRNQNTPEKLEIWNYQPNKSLKKAALNTDELYLSSLRLLKNKQQKLICTGLYAEKDADSWNGRYHQGSIFLQINPDNLEVEIKQFQNFVDQFPWLQPDKTTEKKPKNESKEIGLHKIQLYDVILKKDGGIFLVGEHRSTQYIGTDLSKQIYTHGNIVIINLSAKGKLLQGKTIYKKQQSSAPNSDRVFSYIRVHNPETDQLHFIFNDNPKNLKRKEGKPTTENPLYEYTGYNATKSDIVLVTLNDDGTQQKQLLSSPKQRNIFLVKNLIMKPSKLKLRVIGKKEEYFQIGTLYLSK